MSMAYAVPRAGGDEVTDDIATASSIRRYEERLTKDPASLAFAPLAGLIWWFTQPLPPLAQLLLRLALLAPAGLWLLLARGLDRPAQDELLRRMPARWRVRSLLAAREKI